jgi:hypothetical protein
VNLIVLPDVYNRFYNESRVAESMQGTTVEDENYGAKAKKCSNNRKCSDYQANYYNRMLFIFFQEKYSFTIKGIYSL